MLIIAVVVIVFILDIATKGRYRSKKLGLVLLISGMVFGICLVHGILRVPDPKLLFDLMFLLTMIYLLVSNIRTRMEKKGRRNERTRPIDRCMKNVVAG